MLLQFMSDIMITIPYDCYYNSRRVIIIQGDRHYNSCPNITKNNKLL